MGADVDTRTHGDRRKNSEVRRAGRTRIAVSTSRHASDLGREA
jgi:hypothetical protein